MTAKYNNETFKERLNKINPHIEVLENYTNMRTSILCKCSICGYQWSPLPSNLFRGTGCPACAYNRLFKYDTASFKEKLRIINPNIIVLEEFEKIDKKILCECKVCGHQWNPKPTDLLKGHGCPSCYHVQTSFAEQFIYEALKQVFGKDQVVSRNRKAIGRELDIYIPSHKYAIEFNGWFWHKRRMKQDNEKAHLCKDKGIHALFIYDGCPKKSIPIDAEYMLFPYELRYETDYKTLKNIVNRIITDPVFKLDIISDINWDEVINSAYANSRRKTTDEFRQELSKVNSTISVISEYVDANTKVTCKCRVCGYQWDAVPKSLLKGHGCHRCSNKERYTTESFIQALSKKNSNISVEGEYVNANTKIACRCKVCGYQWNPTPHKLLTGRGCARCSKKERYTEETFKERVKNLNPTITIVGKFTTTNNLIQCVCGTCGNKWETKAKTLINGHGCPVCGNNVNRDSKEDFQRKLKAKNPNVLVIGEYVNNKTPILCKCKICNHEWKPKPHGLLSGYGCPNCAKQKIIDNFKQKLEEKNPNISVLGEYKNRNTKLLFKCNVCGHQWEQTPNAILQKPACPFQKKHK